MSAYYDLYETPSPDGKNKRNHSMHVSARKGLYTQKGIWNMSLHSNICPKRMIGAALDATIDELCDHRPTGNIVGGRTRILQALH